jgi:hypothetical protein
VSQAFERFQKVGNALPEGDLANKQDLKPVTWRISYASKAAQFDPVSDFAELVRWHPHLDK